MAAAREFVMFGLTTHKITGFLSSDPGDIYLHPLEHSLAMAAVIVVAGAFLRYVLEDEPISHRFLQVGLSFTGLALLIAYTRWPAYAASHPEVHFNETWESWLFHIPTILLIAVAIVILTRNRNWLQIVVSIALGFFFINELLFLINYATLGVYNYVLCPIGNAFQILAIPLFGFVYLKEMSIEKKMAEEKLEDYRDHLQDLVDKRTSMLVAQNEIAYSLSRSLDLETILDMALDKVLPVLSMEVGLIFLLDRKQKGLTLKSYQGQLSQDDLELCILEGCPYQRISKEAIRQKKVIIRDVSEESRSQSSHIQKENIRTLYSAPLVSKDEIVGALTLGLRTSTPLSPTNLDLLTSVCNQVGMAVENAYLYREAEGWAEELSMLHEASVNLAATLDPEQIHQEIVIQSARLTGCQIACLIYSDQTCEKSEIISSAGVTLEAEDLACSSIEVCNLLDLLRTTRQSIVVNDVAQDSRIPEPWRSELGIRSLICTPVWGANEPDEFLFLLNTVEQRSWDSKDIELVESFVSRAAVALENAYLHQQLEWAAALEERQRIAANIHDGLAQTISLVGWKIDQTTSLLSNQSEPRVLEALDDIREIVSQASAEARKSIASLQNEPESRKSLQEILTYLAEPRYPDDSFTYDVRLSFPAPLYLNPNQVEQIVPILQEAIYNAQRHSKGTHIEIFGQQTDDIVCISIGDDGGGFDMDDISRQEGNHFGLRIMRTRADRFGGVLQIESAPGQGTTIELSWSLKYKSNGDPGKGRGSIVADLSVFEGGNDA